MFAKISEGVFLPETRPHTNLNLNLNYEKLRSEMIRKPCHFFAMNVYTMRSLTNFSKSVFCPPVSKVTTAFLLAPSPSIETRVP